MNIPRSNLVEILRDLCNEYYRTSELKYKHQYRAKVETVSLLFSLKADLITANVVNIVAEDDENLWGEILFKSLKQHQADFEVDFD